MRVLARLVAGSLFATLASAATAQTYPDRPIRMIVSIAAGSVTDVIMRAAAVELGPRLGQQLVIESRGGASGIPAAQQCAQANPDGYTVCVIYHSTLAFNPLLFNKLPYDADKDFALIARLFFLIEGIAVTTVGLDVNTVAELKALATAKPNALNYGTLGPGSYPELFLKWLNNQWGTSIVGIPYRGGGPIAQALVAGELQMGNMGLGNFMPLLDSGKIKLVAVGAPKRLPLAADVATFAEAGLGDYQGRGWWGLAAPAGTPRAIIDKLNAAINAGLQSDEAKASLIRLSAVAKLGSPQEFASFLAGEMPKWAGIVKLAGAKME